ncbi:serine/threonine-protein kinase [Aquabacter spiritensis]|uniref:Serine/threonine protein kinase n=1 Tax=Aquabacter spiritensis TaxID=933073 RepID=A0A4R3LPZ9_9HYPH|nr:serine/threonine-protein kinase [Aquabacter spiritensis]TCT02482.1 serine/threonine protein kinase [Aquabacter spiritensis]
MPEGPGPWAQVDVLLDRFLSGRLTFDALTRDLRAACAVADGASALRVRLQGHIDGRRLALALAEAIYAKAISEVEPPTQPHIAAASSSSAAPRNAEARLEDALVGTLVDRYRTLKGSGPETTARDRSLDQDLQSFLSLRLRKQAQVGAEGAAGPSRVDLSEPGIGTILRDRFVIDAELGRGGMGIVYKAVDRRRLETGARQPYVALKLLNAEFGAHPDSLRALEAETRRTQELPHPAIVTVYDFDRDGARPYIVMELLEGTSLDRVMRQEPNFIGSPLARSVIRTVIDALAFAHAHGVVHADLKPANVFLCKDGRTKLLDFGISAALQADETGAFDPTTLAAVTPAYATPERESGAAPDSSDDVYALGCMIHILMSGRHPFGRRSGAKAKEQGLTPPSLPMLSAGEEQAVRAALSFDKADRPADAGGFRLAYLSGRDA